MKEGERETETHDIPLLLLPPLLVDLLAHQPLVVPVGPFANTLLHAARGLLLVRNGGEEQVVGALGALTRGDVDVLDVGGVEEDWRGGSGAREERRPRGKKAEGGEGGDEREDGERGIRRQRARSARLRDELTPFADDFRRQILDQLFSLLGERDVGSPSLLPFLCQQSALTEGGRDGERRT